MKEESLYPLKHKISKGLFDNFFEFYNPSFEAGFVKYVSFYLLSACR